MRVRVYVWELPVRIIHWVNFFALLVLCFTGFYIGDPFVIVRGTDAYLTGTIRAVHYIAGYVFLFSFLFRLYWFFVGNEYARWRAFLPLNRADFRMIWDMLKYYLFLRWRPVSTVGHTHLATLAYLFVYFLFLVQIVTGFALYSVGQGGFWAVAFGWVLTLGNQVVRLIHHCVMWLLIGFIIHHIYSAVLLDIEEGNGLVASIFDGYKFIKRPAESPSTGERTRSDTLVPR
jgi:Ni/Fe-hydrogenase 1 B-type cytochrome subunit